MRLQLEQLRQRERLTKQFEERLLVGPLIQITYPLVEKIQAALTRPQHAVVGRDVEVDRSTEMTMVAVVHHLSTNRKLAPLKYWKQIRYSTFMCAQKLTRWPASTTARHRNEKKIIKN